MGRDTANGYVMAAQSCDDIAARAPAVVVFDFDGTLISRDSFFDFALGYCARRPLRLVMVGALIPFSLLLALVRSAAPGPCCSGQ